MVEMSSRVSAALLALLLAVSVTAPAAAAPVLSTPGPLQQTTETPTPAPVTENTTFYVQLQPNGDARWTITDTYALEDENDTEAFEQLAQQFVDGNAGTEWEAAFREANDAATTATGREMNVTSVNRDYVVDDRRGILILEFTWTNFATVDGDRLAVGDAFNTTDGTWLNSLTDDQTLVIAAPAGYGVQSSPPTMGVRNGELRFEGPRTFEPGFLEVAYTGNQGPTTSTTTEDPNPGGALGNTPLWAGALLVLVVGIVVAVGYMNREPGDPSAPVSAASPSDGDDGGDPEVKPESNGNGTDAAEAVSDIDVELLSDEERVERLIEQNGGRMKQARIVKETGWSNAKVSQLLSAMDEDDRIDKLRIGRENLISFPDEDVTEIDE